MLEIQASVKFLTTFLVFAIFTLLILLTPGTLRPFSAIISLIFFYYDLKSKVYLDG